VLGSRALYDRLDHATATLDSLINGLSAGKGTAGALLQDEQLYGDLHKTILDLQALLQDMRENPKKYVTFKIF
jgi:phospholipid/cholesterol/gamma-HCH transport system substrate-binding protein